MGAGLAPGELIGREGELAAIEAWLRRRGAGVFLVTGAPGIGKTALIEAVTHQVQGNRGTLVLRCSEIRTRPFGPLLDAVEESRSRARGRLEWPTVHYRLHHPRAAGDTISRLRRLDEELDQVAQAMTRDAVSQPSVVVVEDLHWADEATAGLFDLLAEDADRLAFPVLLTSRECPASMAVPLSSGSRRRIELPSLSEAAVGLLVQHVLGGPVSTDLTSELSSWSGGNPFVLESLISHALLTGHMRLKDCEWVADELPTATCPPDVAAWMLGQHTSLSDQVWQLLEIASLMGDPIAPQVLLAAVPGEAADTVSLRDLAASRLMSQDTDTNQLVFRHSLVRSAIDSRIGPDRRRSHHARIAEALEAHTPYRFADRARHLLAAGRVREAAPLQVMAADAALGVASYGDARELLTAAMPNLAGSERGSALCRLGLALRQLGDPRGGVDAIQRGVHLLEEAGLDREAGRERLLLGLFLFAVEGPLESEAQYRRAREQLRPYGDSEALALSEVWCGASLVVADQVEAARLDVLRGLDMAVRDGHPSVIAWAHQILGVVEAKSGRMSDGIRLLDHSYREGIELESDVLAEVALHNACVIRQIGLRAQEVESRLIAHRNPSNGANWPMLRDGVLLGALVELGDIDRGLALCESLRSRLSESGAGEMLEWADCAYVILLSDAGRSEEARSVMRGGLDGLLAQDLALRAAAHVRYLLVTGDSEAAADVVDEALKRYDADAVHHRLALAGAQAYLAAGRGTALCALREAVDRDRALQGTAWSELVAGHADLCAGQHASAQRWLAKASRKFVTGSYQLHYARCAALQGIAAGPRAGRPLLERSMATLAARHAEGVADELARLAQRLWMLIDQPPKLTVRESEVLTVLAAGHTDAEIAVALGISPRTVTSHLDRIRDKTGRRRRAELTRLAIELRIGPADGVVPPLV